MAKDKSKRKPFILDTDMSPDSWAAILYLAMHPAVELLAVSVSGTGEAHGETGAHNAARLLALAGKEDVRVGFGPGQPLEGSAHFPGLMRFVIDNMLFLRLPDLDSEPLLENSLKMIPSILGNHPHPVTIAAVGPQTNLASILLDQPELAQRIESISVMGGAVDAPGNIREIAFWKRNEAAEWNFFCDPAAVKSLLSSGANVHLVPLDLTNQVPVTREFVERFKQCAGNPAADFVLRMLGVMAGNFRRKAKFYLWDPMTCAIAVQPELCQLEKMRLDIITEPGDRWAGVVRSEAGSDVNVAVHINKEGFENSFIKAFC